jgi:hypothetical protein
MGAELCDLNLDRSGRWFLCPQMSRLFSILDAIRTLTSASFLQKSRFSSSSSKDSAQIVNL